MAVEDTKPCVVLLSCTYGSCSSHQHWYLICFEPVGDKGKRAQPGKAAGPVGGVKPGLGQDESQPLQGPEPLMGVQHLQQVEQGDLTSADEAVLTATLSCSLCLSACCLFGS